MAALALSPKVALANADDELKTAVYKFKTAEKIRACKTFMSTRTEAIELSEAILNEEVNSRPYDEGEGDGRARVNCDVLYLANADGHGDYFGKYLSEHAKLGGNADGDESKISKDNQVVLADTSNTTVLRVKDKLGQNDLRSLMVRKDLMAEATESYPYHKLGDLGQAAEAQMYKEIAETYCTESHPPFTEAAQDGKLAYVDKGSDGKYTVKKGYFSFKGGESGKGRRVSVWPAYYPQGEPDMSCWDVVQRYSDRADAYAAALNQHIDEHPGDTETTPADETDEDDNTCQKELKGLGYILCPGVSVISDMIDHLYEFFGGFLDWQFLAGNSGKQIQSYWAQFLSIANVILVIAFLVILYSIATSTGLTNYDVKKMLPRLILFAVVINTSFYICAVISDLSNIAGKGAYSMLAGMKKIGEDSVAQSLFMKALTDLASVGTILFILFGLSFGMTILISLITIIIAISVRNLGLVLLVIISPIAFTLYIFPNESIQRWGRRWFDMFIKMIIVYPVFMLVVGGSSLIRNIGGNIGAGLPIITEMACAALPALSIIPLFKMSGDMLGRATSLVHGSQATAAVAKAGHDAIARSRVGQGAGRVRSNILQAAQNRFGDVPLVGGALRSAGVNDAIAAPGRQYNELDQQAMQNASEKVDGMSSAEQREGFLNGTANGRQIADTHTMRAIIAKQAPNATMADAQQSMQSVNARANWLQEHGREREADELRRDYANAMIENGKSGISAATLQSWADTGWEDDRFNANYSDAISNYATGLSTQAQADMSAADLVHMRQTLQNSAASGGNVAATDAGISNVRDQASSALSNRDMLSKMSATTRSALVDNSLLRSTGGQNLADTHKLANVYHDFNSGGANATAAATRATALISHADFSRMDEIDRNRLMDIATTPDPAGSATPVQIASWDRRMP